MTMKKSLIALSSMASAVSFASDYVIVVDKNTEYTITETYTEVVETTEWVDQGALTNCSSSPLSTDYYKGVSFSQEDTCSQKQVRDKNT